MKTFSRFLIPALATLPWLVANSQSLGGPKVLRLPPTPYKYADASQQYPRYYTDPAVPGSAKPADNTPANNAISDNGATLGRVLFYDKTLSRGLNVACASCHQQSHGFSDPGRFSTGTHGGLTTRHSMGIGNTRYYQNGRMFWDERSATLEDQVLQPIQNSVEMDMTLPEVIQRMQGTNYYPSLFQKAFGSVDITSDRISKALAQFVRAIVNYRSKFDSAIDANGVPHFQTVFTPQEFLGMRLFQPVQGLPNISRGCDRCHTGVAQISTQARNNGLDLNTPGGGRFKSPSLRNIAVRGPYMHDGRFPSLNAVVNFYNNGVQNNPALDPIMRDPATGQPRRLNLTPTEVDALVAFLGTLTDSGVATDDRFSNPFISLGNIPPVPIP